MTAPTRNEADDDIPVPSPCTGVCRIDADGSGLCAGCLRTRDEIATWSTMRNPDKRRVWQLLPARGVQHPPPQEPPRVVLSWNRRPAR